MKIRKELEKLRQENPSDPWIYWISGISCNPMIETEEATAFHRQAIAADPTFPHAYYNLAITIEGSDEASLNELVQLYTKAVIRSDIGLCLSRPR